MNSKIIKNYLYNLSYQILVLLAPLITTPYISITLGASGIGIYGYAGIWAVENCFSEKQQRKVNGPVLSDYFGKVFDRKYSSHFLLSLCLFCGQGK